MEGLDGGVHCERGAPRDPGDRSMFQMAHYEPGNVLGPRIVLHHGAFEKMGFADHLEYRREIRITLRHELRHHWEDRAGLPDLRDEEQHWLALHREPSEKQAAAPRWVLRLLGAFVVLAVGLATFLVAPGPPLVRAIGGGMAAALAYRALQPRKRRKKKKRTNPLLTGSVRARRLAGRRGRRERLPPPP